MTTLCGRHPVPGTPTAIDLPWGDKSCETCLRILEGQTREQYDDVTWVQMREGLSWHAVPTGGDR